jgi:hypothetical protein
MRGLSRKAAVIEGGGHGIGVVMGRRLAGKGASGEQGPQALLARGHCHPCFGAPGMAM